MSTTLEYKEKGRRGQKKSLASAQLESTINPKDRDPFRRRSQLSVGRRDDEGPRGKDAKPERRYSEKLNIEHTLYELLFCDDGSGRPHLEQVNIARPNSSIIRCYKRFEEKDPSFDPSLYPMSYCFKFFGRESEWTVVTNERKVYNNLAAALLMAKNITIYEKK